MKVGGTAAFLLYLFVMTLPSSFTLFLSVFETLLLSLSSHQCQIQLPNRRVHPEEAAKTSEEETSHAHCHELLPALHAKAPEYDNGVRDRT